MASKRKRTPKSKSPTLHVERVRLNRQGYDSRDRYWGVGEPLYRVTCDDPSVDEYVRASTSKRAKDAVIAKALSHLRLRAVPAK